MTTQFRIDLPEDQAARLAELAAFRATTPEVLLKELAQSLLADAAALDAWIAEGEADVAAGRVVPFEEVMAELDDIIARARVRRA
jgi:predicted transcriptional regulator